MQKKDSSKHKSIILGIFDQTATFFMKFIDLNGLRYLND